MMRRRLLYKTEPGDLPADYLAVQYLQAPSGQYIVTNIYPALTITYEAEVEHNPAGDQALCGGRVSTYQTVGGIGYYNNRFQNFYSSYFYTGNIVSGRAVYKIEMTNGSQTGYINDVVAGTGNKTMQTLGDFLPISIFGITNKNNNGIEYPFTGKCYWLKIFINNTLAGHLIPCIRIADSKPGLYDLVGRQFYTNQGTGEFVIPS